MSADYTDSALFFINVEQWLFSFFWRAADSDWYLTCFGFLKASFVDPFRRSSQVPRVLWTKLKTKRSFRISYSAIFVY